jgi:hypothetical protein
MKKIKINLSKTSWIILSVGIFLVVLGGLGVTYSQKAKEKKEVDEQLELTNVRLDMFNISELEDEKYNLEVNLANNTKRHESLGEKLVESVISSDVTEKCYEIASQSNVEIFSIGSTDIKIVQLAALECNSINVQVTVTGELPDFVTYVKNLNQEFSTGYITSVKVELSEVEDEPNKATIQLVVYSYEG